MTKTISGENFEKNRPDYDFEIFKLQKENLELTIKHQKRFWLNTIISIIIGMIATLSIQFLSDKFLKESKKPEPSIQELYIESKMKLDSMYKLNISNIRLIDSLKKN